jgi:hypothetical protein
VEQLLGLAEDQASEWSRSFTVESDIRWVESIGRVREPARGIVVCVRLNGMRATVLEWREFVVPPRLRDR